MRKMRFEPCITSLTYQRVMSKILQKIIDRICIKYLDDMIVFSKKRSVHAADLRAVLDRIRFDGLKLKPSKCFCLTIRFCTLVTSFREPANPPISQNSAYLPTGRLQRRFVRCRLFWIRQFSRRLDLGRIWADSTLCDITAARKDDELIKLKTDYL